MEGSSDVSEAVIETLRRRGWCFGELKQIKAMILIHSAISDDDTPAVVDSVESELVNMDLRSIGGNSFPELPLLRKASHLQGPKVLQISSVRDVSRSSIEQISKNSSSKRLLRLGLTDGVSEIIAIEYSHVPAILDDIVPGTKVRLENKAAIHHGILCLNPKVLTIMGGVVQSLYEEWQMNQKYPGLFRPSLRLSQESDTGGPPPFEKLQIGAPSHRFSQQGRVSYYSKSASKSSELTAVETVVKPDIRPSGRQHNFNMKKGNLDNNRRTASLSEITEEKPSSSYMRPKDYSMSTSKSNELTAVETVVKPDVRLSGRQHNVNMKKGNLDNNWRTASFSERTEEKPSSSDTRPKEDYSKSTSKSNVLTVVETVVNPDISNVLTAVETVVNPDIRPSGRQHNVDLKIKNVDNNWRTASLTEINEEKPSSSEMRPIEVAESAPFQNQAAAQKLLQKMNQRNGDDRSFRGRKHRGKGKEEERQVFTLDEWEQRKAGAKLIIKNDISNISHDENLAWQLQNQLDLEDSRVQRDPKEADAENIRMSMFKYERADDRIPGNGMGRGGRGRGGARGRGRGGGKGKGKRKWEEKR